MTEQSGAGRMMVFHGGRFQRGYGQVGYGLGSFFQSLARKAMPFLQSGAKSLGESSPRYWNKCC